MANSELLKEFREYKPKGEAGGLLDEFRAYTPTAEKPKVKYRGLLPPEIIPPTVTTPTGVGGKPLQPSEKPYDVFKEIQRTAEKYTKEIPREYYFEKFKDHPVIGTAIVSLIDLAPTTPVEAATWYGAGKGFKYGGKAIKAALPEKTYSAIKAALHKERHLLTKERFNALSKWLDDTVKKAEVKYKTRGEPLTKAEIVEGLEKIETGMLEPWKKMDETIAKMAKDTGVPIKKMPESELESKTLLRHIKRRMEPKPEPVKKADISELPPELQEAIKRTEVAAAERKAGEEAVRKAVIEKYSKPVEKLPPGVVVPKAPPKVPKPRNLKPTDELEEQLIKDGADAEREVFKFFESKIPTEKEKTFKQMIKLMTDDVSAAEPGKRVWAESGKEVVHSFPSTYPRWWPEARTSRKGFLRAVETEKGPVWERIKDIAQKYLDEGFDPYLNPLGTLDLHSGLPMPAILKRVFGKGKQIHPHETMAKNAMKDALAEKAKMNEVYGLSPFKGFLKEAIKWPRETFIHARETLSKSVPGGHLAYLGQKLDLVLEKEKSASRKLVWQAFKGIKKRDRHEFRLAMESDIAEHPEKVLTIANPRIREAIPKWVEVNKKVLEIAEAMGQDVSKWGYKVTNYFPRMWRGQWQVYKTVGKGKTETLAFVKGQGNAEVKAKELMNLHPDIARNIHIKPRVMWQDFSATELSKPGFKRAVNNFAEAFDMTFDDIINSEVLKGVISIKRKRVFVPSFLKRKGKLEGYEEDPVFVYQSLFNRILRKKYVEPFSKDAQALIQKMPTAQKKFAQEYVDKLCGKYSEYPNMQKIMKYASPFMTKLKLGWRGVTGFVNHLQKLQQTLSEVGLKQMARTYAMKFTKAGRAYRNDIIERTNVLGGEAKYYAGEWTRWGSERWSKDMSMWWFRSAEKSNRSESIVTLVDDAMKRFNFKAVAKEQLKEGVPKNMVFKSQKEMADAYGIMELSGTQGHYGMADFPAIMRGPWGQALMKFKPFTINFINQMVKVSTGKPLAGTEVFWNSIGGMPKSYAIARAARWWGSNIMVGGIRSLPIPAFTGTMAYLAMEYPKNPLVSGILAPLGFDISGQAGVHDPWQFYNWYDIFGPYAGTAGRVIRAVKSGNIESLWAEWPAGRGVYEALRSEDQYSIYNKEMIRRGIDWKERFAIAAGFTPMQTSLYRLLNEQAHMFQDEQQEIRARYDPQFIKLFEKASAAQQKGDRKESDRINKEIDGLMDKILEEGGWYSPEIFQNLMQRRMMERPERMLKRGMPFIPKPKREEFLEMIQKVGALEGKPQTQITQ